MGERGPVGKRPDMKHGHRTAAELQHDEMAPMPVTWPEPGEHWDSAAVRWYRSLEESAQSIDYQQSDVSLAWVTAENLSRYLADDKPMNGPAMTAFLAANTDLLASAGARRRAKLELARPDGAADAAQDAAVASLAAKRRSKSA